MWLTANAFGTVYSDKTDSLPTQMSTLVPDLALP